MNSLLEPGDDHRREQASGARLANLTYWQGVIDREWDHVTTLPSGPEYDERLELNNRALNVIDEEFRAITNGYAAIAGERAFRGDTLADFGLADDEGE